MTALYSGIVTHERFAPVRHKLRLRIFMVFLRLDGAGLPRLFGFNRPGLLSFHAKDFGSGQDLPGFLAHLLNAAGLPPAPDISVLCMPRVLGHAFNPLAVFFCRDSAGELRALIHQVNNTFGQRHFYVLPASGARVQQECAKAFHVSPFMGMAMQYRFTVREPGPRASIVIAASGAEGKLLLAAFAGRRVALTNGAVLRAALSMPWLGLKTLGGIHWHALILFLRGLRLLPAPPEPARQWSPAPRATHAG